MNGTDELVYATNWAYQKLVINIFGSQWKFGKVWHARRAFNKIQMKKKKNTNMNSTTHANVTLKTYIFIVFVQSVFVKCVNPVSVICSKIITIDGPMIQ